MIDELVALVVLMKDARVDHHVGGGNCLLIESWICQILLELETSKAKICRAEKLQLTCMWRVKIVVGRYLLSKQPLSRLFLMSRSDSERAGKSLHPVKDAKSFLVLPSIARPILQCLHQS